MATASIEGRIQIFPDEPITRESLEKKLSPISFTISHVFENGSQRLLQLRFFHNKSHRATSESSTDAPEPLVTTELLDSGNIVTTPGVTTNLYQEAYTLMKTIATTLNTPLNYQFSTRRDSMIRWAESLEKGRGLFDWDKVNISGDGLFEAHKTIRPQTPTQ